MRRSVRVLLLMFQLACFSVPVLYGQVYSGLCAGGGLSSDTGLRLAVPFEWHWSANGGIFMEMAFVQRTNNELLRRLDEGNEREYLLGSIDYFSIPVLGKFALDWHPVSLYALAGGELGYGLRVGANYFEANRFSRKQFLFSELGIHRWDLGLVLGFGMETVIRQHRKIFIDIRHFLGILDFDPSAQEDLYNEGTVVMIGFLLPLGKMADAPGKTKSTD